MTARLAHIWRHPIKSHGREVLAQVTLAAGQTLPWDRHWAVTHALSKWNAADPRWMACANFLIGSSIASLMAIDARLQTDQGTLTLTHPDRPPLTLHPDDTADRAGFLDWLAPLLPPDRQATALVRAEGRGMTDTDYPSVSLCNLASNQSLSAALQAELSPLRWRGNLWVDGWQPWAEFALIGRNLRIGPVVLSVRERIKRCKATTANPATGIRDIDTLAGLRQHTEAQDFGVYATVVQGGSIRLGDPVEVLA